MGSWAKKWFLPSVVLALTLLNAVAAEDSGEESVQSGSTVEFFFMVLLILAILFIFGLTHTKMHYMPESIATLLLGLATGLVLWWSDSPLMDKVQVDPSAFFLVLIPPIIFEAGYSLRARLFMRNIGTILLYAVPGTALSTVVVGLGVNLIGSAGWSPPLSMSQSMAFGALISAVDPVCTLSLFQRMKVEEKLYILVFGESVLNDAVAVVLYHLFVSVEESNAFLAILQLLLIGAGSLAVAVVGSLATSILLRVTYLHLYPEFELSLLMVSAYLPYALSEALGLSGIISVLFSGMMMQHYARPLLNPITQVTAQSLFTLMSFLSETLVFVYLGLAVFAMNHSWNVVFLLLTFLFCLVGRAVNIFPITLLVNKSRARPIGFRSQFMMWFAGLRGIIAFALALSFPEPYREEIKTATLGIALITILVFGGTTAPVVKTLGLDAPTVAHEPLPSEADDSMMSSHAPGTNSDSDPFEEDAEDLQGARRTNVSEGAGPVSSTFRPKKRHILHALDTFDISIKQWFAKDTMAPGELINAQTILRTLVQRWYQRAHRQYLALPPVGEPAADAPGGPQEALERDMISLMRMSASQRSRQMRVSRDGTSIQASTAEGNVIMETILGGGNGNERNLGSGLVAEVAPNGTSTPPMSPGSSPLSSPPTVDYRMADDFGSMHSAVAQ